MEVSLAQRQAPQIQRDVDITTPVNAAVATASTPQSTQSVASNTTDPRLKVDKAPLLGVAMAEKPTLSEEQTLKPYGVIMLPFREEDETTTRIL